MGVLVVEEEEVKRKQSDNLEESEKREKDV